MPKSLTLAEFRARLVDPLSRRDLGLQLDDQDTLRLMADEQRLVEVYSEWKSGGFALPAPQLEERPRQSFWRTPLAWGAGGAVVVALVVGAVTAGNAIAESNRKAAYAEILRQDTTVTENLRELSGESLDASFNSDCAKVREGWTEADQREAAERNWEGVSFMSEVSKSQWIANNVATFRAALEVCG